MVLIRTTTYLNCLLCTVYFVLYSRMWEPMILIQKYSNSPTSTVLSIFIPSLPDTDITSSSLVSPTDTIKRGRLSCDEPTLRAQVMRPAVDHVICSIQIALKRGNLRFVPRAPRQHLPPTVSRPETWGQQLSSTGWEHTNYYSPVAS